MCRHGGTYKALCTCLKHKLVHHDASKYDGYRLTPLGYDFLAIHTLSKRGTLTSVGRQIGVGKESDIFEVRSERPCAATPANTPRRRRCNAKVAVFQLACFLKPPCTALIMRAHIPKPKKSSVQVTGEHGEVLALKLHRLGRTSFRAVRRHRDYVRRGHHFSWLYLSRLAATKEHAFMAALGARGLPVPRAVGHNRHAVLMERIDGVPLVQVRRLRAVGKCVLRYPGRLTARCACDAAASQARRQGSISQLCTAERLHA